MKSYFLSMMLFFMSLFIFTSCLPVEQMELIPHPNPENFNLTALPYPYNETKVLLEYNDFGWFGYSNKCTLEKILQERKPKHILEIGSFYGKSTRFFANNTDEDAVIYAIDLWGMDSVEEVIKTMVPNITIFTDHFYDQFLSNVIHTNFTHKIIPIKEFSQNAGKILKTKNLKFDLIYIDGGHTYDECYTDIITYVEFLKPDGIICGDDYKWNNYEKKDFPVKKAVDQFAAENPNMKLWVNGNWFWYFTEKEYTCDQPSIKKTEL